MFWMHPECHHFKFSTNPSDLTQINTASLPCRNNSLFQTVKISLTQIFICLQHLPTQIRLCFHWSRASVAPEVHSSTDKSIAKKSYQPVCLHAVNWSDLSRTPFPGCERHRCVEESTHIKYAMGGWLCIHSTIDWRIPDYGSLEFTAWSKGKREGKKLFEGGDCECSKDFSFTAQSQVWTHAGLSLL